MELILKNNEGQLLVDNSVLDFKFENNFPRANIFIEKEMENPLLQIVLLEKLFRDRDFKEFSIKLPAYNKKTINFFLDSTYDVTSGNKEFFSFHKKIDQKKAIRLSLTENCNYKCFFCHEEGLDMSSKRGNASFEEMCKLLITIRDFNYEDLTFTGGEPLIAKNELIKYLRFMVKNGYTPDITIVTNGYLIDDELLQEIKQYPGNFKFNLSMHAVTEDVYYDVVIPKNSDKDSFNKVLKNIKKINDYGISLKMNFVLLNGINTSEEYLKKILNFAYEHRATNVKFLEFLITEKLNKFYDYYFKTESAIELLKDELTLHNITYRRSEYLYKNGLIVEFQKCTCGNGCNVCPLNREINITPQMKYYPCFIYPTAPIDINSKNFSSALAQGDSVIETLIKKYGEKSPIIIKNAPNTGSKKEYIFKLNFELKDLELLLEENGFHLDRQRKFQDIFYSHNGAEWEFFQKILKLSKNSFDNSYREIVQNRVFNSHESSVETEFLTDGQLINSLADYENYLSHLGFSRLCTMDWNIKFYEKKNLKFSIGHNIQTGNIYLTLPKNEIELFKFLTPVKITQDIYIENKIL